MADFHKNLGYEKHTTDFCHDKSQSPLLSERAKTQLSECASEEDIKDILNCKNGYAELWFDDADRLYLKKLETDLYEVWAVRRKNDVIAEIRKYNFTASEIVELYGRQDLFYSRKHYDDAKTIFNRSVINGSYPLMEYAKQTGDLYLEYELKFLAGIASDDEIVYLESVIRRDRFIARKSIYDVDSIEVIETVKKQERYFHRPELWMCEITLDGERRKCVWNKGRSEIIVQMNYGEIGFELNNVCRISNRLKDKFEEKVNLQI